VIRADIGTVLLPKTNRQNNLEPQAILGGAEYAETLARAAQPLIEHVRHTARPDIIHLFTHRAYQRHSRRSLKNTGPGARSRFARPAGRAASIYGQ